jgi:hypothetical protein
MAGDLLGAAALTVSTMPAAARVFAGCNLPWCLRTVLRPPFVVSVYFFGQSGLMLLLAQPVFALSLTGQVFMGTVYVLNVQAIHEMLLKCAYGDHDLYRRIVLANQCIFTTGCALFSAVGIFTYEGLGSFAAAFRCAAGLSAVVGVCFGCFFALRITRTSNGELAEVQLHSAEADVRGVGDGAGCGVAARLGEQLMHTEACSPSATAHVPHAVRT